MRSYIKHTILRLLLVSTFALSVPAMVYSQPPPQDPAEGENPVPIGSGLLILLVLSVGYGVVKMKQRKRE